CPSAPSVTIGSRPFPAWYRDCTIGRSAASSIRGAASPTAGVAPRSPCSTASTARRSAATIRSMRRLGEEPPSERRRGGAGPHPALQRPPWPASTTRSAESGGRRLLHHSGGPHARRGGRVWVRQVDARAHGHADRVANGG